MLEIIKNFFTSFFSNEQQNSNNSENSTATHFSTNSNSFCSTSATQEENNEIKPIINEGSFKKNNFYDRELIKDIVNSEKNKPTITKGIKKSIIGNYQTDKISKISHYETHVESYTKEQEKINSYNYRT